MEPSVPLIDPVKEIIKPGGCRANIPLQPVLRGRECILFSGKNAIVQVKEANFEKIMNIKDTFFKLGEPGSRILFGLGAFYPDHFGVFVNEEVTVYRLFDECFVEVLVQKLNIKPGVTGYIASLEGLYAIAGSFMVLLSFDGNRIVQSDLVHSPRICSWFNCDGQLRWGECVLISGNTAVYRTGEDFVGANLDDVQRYLDEPPPDTSMIVNAVSYDSKVPVIDLGSFMRLRYAD